MSNSGDPLIGGYIQDQVLNWVLAENSFIQLRLPALYAQEPTYEKVRAWLAAVAVARFQWREGLSEAGCGQLFCYARQWLVVPQQLIGLPVEIALQGAQGGGLYILVVSAVQVSGGTSSGVVWFELGLQDAFTFWAQTIHDRVFNDMDALAITRHVLAECVPDHFAAPFALILDEHASQDTVMALEALIRPFTLQYGQTDYAFLLRLWCEQGWHWHVRPVGEIFSGVFAVVLSLNSEAWPDLGGFCYLQQRGDHTRGQVFDVWTQQGRQQPSVIGGFQPMLELTQLVGGRSGVLGLRVGQRFTIEALQPPLNSLALITVHVAARNRSVEGVFQADGPVYENQFTAMEGAGLSQQAYTAQMKQPLGMLIATVVGSDDNAAAATVHTDAMGRVRLRFEGELRQFDPNHRTAWVPVVQPQAGLAGQVWLPRVGDTVVVHFLNGHPDHPIVIGAVYSQAQGLVRFAQRSQWPQEASLSGVRSCAWPQEHQEIQAVLGSELVFDDHPNHVQVRLASDVAATRLALGALSSPAQNYARIQRGQGFELSSTGHGVLAASAGVLISTQAGSHYQPLWGRESLMRDWQSLQQVQRSLLASTQGGASKFTDSNALDANSLETHRFSPNSKSPFSVGALVLHAHGVAHFQAAKGVQMASGEGVCVVSGRDLELLSGQSMRFVSASGINLQANRGGLGLTAQAGDFSLGAPQGAVKVQAQGNFELHSSDGRVLIQAPNAIELRAGGAVIRMENGNIDIHAPGVLSVRAQRKMFGAAVEHIMVEPENLAQPKQADQTWAVRLRCQTADQAPLSGGAWRLFAVKNSELSTTSAPSERVYELLQESSNQELVWQSEKGVAPAPMVALLGHKRWVTSLIVESADDGLEEGLAGAEDNSGSDSHGPQD